MTIELAPQRYTQIWFAPPAWDQTHKVDLGAGHWRSGGGGRLKKSEKVKKSIFAISLCFDPASLTESPATSYAASRPLSHPLTHLNPSLTLHIRALSSAKVGCGVDMSKIFEKSENFRKISKITSHAGFRPLSRQIHL